MRLLHVTAFYEPACSFGGTARAASGLCRALARRGHEVTLATALLDPAHPAEEVLGGVDVHRFAGPELLARRLFPWAPGLHDFLAARARSFDLAHLHGHRNGLAWTAFRALRSARVPWLLQPHGSFPDHGQRRALKRLFDAAVGGRIVAGARALVALSVAEASDLPRPARVVGNGVELDRDVPARSRPGRRLLFVGSDRPQKRGAMLPGLLAALPGARLELAGPLGPRFLASFGPLRDRVAARGVLSGAELAEAYASADVVVHPAVGEAFGLVPFEAALAGTPAVVAGGHGCGEWFARAGGCVVPPDDAAALRRAVGERLDAPGVGAREAAAVADFTRRELTWERAAQAVEALYREVAGGPREGAA
jgi:glycosyltransferase involved in cell wall biosynthesis